ncbi:hypothetical protein [Sporisorium scitamineum]|uniref:Cytokinesis protein sepA n=1 Tax=Sporisorium scitamineum TaxID=49012 RepID=A0A0F7RZD4_9BASI|nr:hypothetical protein [Sporisorium scitamineum]
MDSIFGRKKRSRQFNSDAADKAIPYERTASGRTPVHVDSVLASSSYHTNASPTSSKLSIGNPSGNPALGSGVHHSSAYSDVHYDVPRSRLANASSSSTAEDFAPYPSLSSIILHANGSTVSSSAGLSSHRRNPSAASSSRHGVSTHDSMHSNSSSFAPNGTRSSRYTSNTSLGPPNDSNSSIRYHASHMPHDVISRMSVASTATGAYGDDARNAPNDQVERLFAELMDKRDFLNVPGGNLSDELKETARRNMLNFSVDKKWTLVYNDKLTEWHAEKERDRNRRHHAGQPGPAGAGSSMVITRNSPEWFIKKFMDGTVTTKHIESLAVTLRTCAIGWIQSFVEAKGTPVLASFLSGLHAKGIKNDNDLALEYEVLKAFRSLFNSKPGANDSLAQPKCISGITHSMISLQLTTRKQAADILLFLCHWDKPTGHRLVLKAFDDLKTSQGDHGRFDAWFRVLEQTIDGRGKMGSMVGASDEVKKLSVVGPHESSLNEYAINNMFLINAILNSDIVPEFEVRVHLRNQMEASGLQRILIKMHAFKNPDLDAQIGVFEKGAEADHEDVVETFNKEVLTDLSDPVDVFRAIVGKVEGSRAYDFFLSALQHLLLIRRDGDDLVHYYQLIDSMVTSVVMDRKGAVEGNDLSSLLGVSVNNVLSRFADQDHINSMQSELQKAKAKAAALEQEKMQLESKLKAGSDGLIGKLQEQIEKLEDDLALARGNAGAARDEMDEMEKAYIDRVVVLEIQIRELYDMLREAQMDVSDVAAPGKGSLDRQQLVDTLEKQLERNKTIRKLEANARKNKASGKGGDVPPVPAMPGTPTEDDRKRISASVRRQPTLARSAESGAKGANDDEEQDEGHDEEPLDPEAAKWKIQATLAAGMAQNTDLASRMVDARESRRRKAQAPSPKGAAKRTSHPAVRTLLDEIRRQREDESDSDDDLIAGRGKKKPTALSSVSEGQAVAETPTSSQGISADMRSAFSTPDSSRPGSMLASGAGTSAPPAPPPPGSVTESPMQDGNLFRNSMMNVRASYAPMNLGPAGPIAAPPAPGVAGLFANHALSRKEVLAMARSKMKQLQWDKLSPQHAAETIFGQHELTADEEQVVKMLQQEGLFDEMEEDFKAKQPVKKSAATAKKDRIELKTHLSLQTRQGIEMVLKRVKSSLTESKQASPEEVAHHIINCNEAVLDQSFLTELLRHYPESETKGQLGEYRNASDEELRLLHPADRLVVLLMTVPHLKEKVKGLLYMTKYKETFDLIKSGTVKVRDASEGLMKAKAFARLLSLILMMGNYLNSTGVQGGAFGFKITSINKLVDTKASDGTTLLHFIERTISKCFPEVEAFMDELELPAEACRVQLWDLRRDLAELKSGSFQHRKDLDRLLDENEENLQDPYVKIMLPFLNDAASELQRLNDQVQFTERVYNEALKYFGEGLDPKKRGLGQLANQTMRTEDFFGIFKEFLAAYKKVKVDNVRIGEQRAMEAKRRAAAEEREKERQEALARKEAGVDDSAVLETLLGSLRSGAGGGGSEDSAGGVGSVLVGAQGSPSDVAAAMLAKLQGGEEGGEQQAAAASASAFRTTRRRDRRSGRDAPHPPGSTLAGAVSSPASSAATAQETASPTMTIDSSPSLSQQASSTTHTPSASISVSSSGMRVLGDTTVGDATLVPSSSRSNGASDAEGGSDLEWFDPDLSGFSAAGQSVKSNNGA